MKTIALIILTCICTGLQAQQLTPSGLIQTTGESGTGYIGSGMTQWNSHFEISSTNSGDYHTWATRDSAGKWKVTNADSALEVVYKSQQIIDKYYRLQCNLHEAALMIIDAYRKHNTKDLIKAYNHYNTLNKPLK